MATKANMTPRHNPTLKVKHVLLETITSASSCSLSVLATPFPKMLPGVAQITICAFGGSCGAGIPGLQYPYGDQKGDAIDVKKGFDYAAAKAAGCQ